MDRKGCSPDLAASYFCITDAVTLEIASNGQSVHDSGMSEDDEIGSIQDEIREYKRQLDLLREHLEIVIRFANVFLVHQANQYASGNPAADPVVKEKCRSLSSGIDIWCRSDHGS